MGRERLVRQMLRSRFLVTTDSEETFDGILTDWDSTYFIYGDVFTLAKNGDRLHLDTALWIPRERIKYMQAVNP